jgi:hypothetical protein
MVKLLSAEQFIAADAAEKVPIRDAVTHRSNTLD